MTTLTVYRGGWLPSDQDDAADRIERFGCIFAHEDRSIAATYGRVGKIQIDTARYLDARPADVWRSLKRDALRARDMGYAGVIYPDDHDWEEPPEGAEIAIFDASTIIFG